MWKWLRGFWKSSAKRPEQAAAATAAPDSPRASTSAGSPFVRRAVADVSVGLDFGTHGPKVVYYLRSAGARTFRPLSFGHSLTSWPRFVLPAVGVIDSGQLIWGERAGELLESRAWDDGIRRLKALFAARGSSAFADNALDSAYLGYLSRCGVKPSEWVPEVVMTAALALQIETVYTLLKRELGAQTVRAQFAIPVPIDQVQNSRVFSLYRRVANAAATLVDRDGALTVPRQQLMNAAAERFSAASDAESAECNVDIMPEAVAQLASYRTSLSSEEGVHGVVDIGAGTTDVSVFMFAKDRHAGISVTWYGAVAAPLATSHVFSRLADRVTGKAERRATESEIRDACASFADDVRTVLESIRIPWAQRAWATGFGHNKKQSTWTRRPVFLCGGGAALPNAEKVFQRAWIEKWGPHPIKPLPVPRDYDGKGVPFDRMAVAYGLAIPRPEHGDYVLPNDAPDHTPPRIVRPPDDGMGGDQLYPTPGWT